ncbi:hypothetical protein K443DRAFT_459570 [Laccaria amethystina LaAM-08-1]|uniref:Unplaced genomic scaffold K443scaffold_409, whole genome shotgun sequence n=1 Tax=Laccaria amethystina LaAM-08-1 TaxID=1095629 RepID=A0A0C9WNL8_9AGAR|nr:hypothetical protein K443DRAFT_459570 [Laccaria amethystina LaAM-08-1]
MNNSPSATSALQTEFFHFLSIAYLTPATLGVINGCKFTSWHRTRRYALPIIVISPDFPHWTASVLPHAFLQLFCLFFSDSSWNRARGTAQFAGRTFLGRGNSLTSSDVANVPCSHLMELA